MNATQIHIKAPYNDFNDAPGPDSESAIKLAKKAGLRFNPGSKSWAGSPEQVEAFIKACVYEIEVMTDWLGRQGTRWSINISSKREHVARLGRVITAAKAAT